MDERTRAWIDLLVILTFVLSRKKNYKKGKKKKHFSSKVKRKSQKKKVLNKQAKKQEKIDLQSQEKRK